MANLKIVVLFGGASPEYPVSLRSAQAILEAMDPQRFTPVPVGITPDGQWYFYRGALSAIGTDTWRESEDCVPAMLSVNRGERALLCFQGQEIQRIYIDAVFPVLHGQNGEDGSVQGLCELAGIPLVGCGTLASALCMDKDRAHRLAAQAGIPSPAGSIVPAGASAEFLHAQAHKLGYPLFVKPLKAGSSFGITRVTQRTQLDSAAVLARQYDDVLILEQAVAGFEVGCAVMGNEQLYIGEVDEIELSQGFFDFSEKYTLKSSKIHVPARIDAKTAERIKETAETVYRALGCRGFARVDMFLTPDGQILFNEVNTIPGFTAHSRFPAMLKAAGFSFPQIVRFVIELAVRT